MSKRNLTAGEETAWRAVDRALFGEEDPAAAFTRAMDRRPVASREKSLGATLKRLRKERGITPTQAAAQAGVPAPSWRNWEANRWIPGEEELARVTVLLGRERGGELWHLRRRAPRVLLARALDTRPTLQVARSSGESPAPPPDPGARWRLAVENLDPALRAGLVRFLQRQRLDASPEGQARALEAASGLPEPEQSRWLDLVASQVRL